MHIRIEGDTRGAYDLKWRGVALDGFDGRRWYNSMRRRSVLTPSPPSGGRFTLPWAPQTPAEAARTQPSRIRYRVVSEPLGSDVFFLAPLAEALYVNYRNIATDEDSGALFSNDRYRVISAYAGVSNIRSPAAAALRAATGEYPVKVKGDRKSVV